MPRLISALLMLLASASALAQEEEEAAPLSAAPLEDKTATKIDQVEHGFFVGAAAGAQFMVSPPGGGGLTVGQSGGFELGFEPVPVVAFGVLVWGANGSATSSFGNCGGSAGGCTQGFSSLTIGGDVRVNLALGPDADDIRRTFFYFRGGAGYSIIGPKDILPSEVLVFGGPGIEYFTHLRHFSIGAEVDATFGLSNHGLGILAQPVIRYTF